MKLQFSAGGIVVRGDRVLVCQHSQHHGWVFPKGLIDKKESGIRNNESGKETKEEAALREVKEETGVEAKITKPLAPITYWFKMENETIKKTVYYFLMEYMDGDITEHDHEMENVEFLPIDEVKKRLTYKSDKKVWKEARNLIVTG